MPRLRRSILWTITIFVLVTSCLSLQPPRLLSGSLLKQAESVLSAVVVRDEDRQQNGMTSRRMAIASALVASGVLIGPGDAQAQDTFLRWETSPINKRSGVTVFDAESAGYNVQFVTYLSRFLLNFDKECQRWWFARSNDLPRRASADEINQLRMEQFGAFSASVELGLREFEGPDGPRNLLQSLLNRYCTENNNSALTSTPSTPTLTDAEKRKRREINSARRQIALMFGLLGGKTQPVAELTKLLAVVDNGSIVSVQIKKDGVVGGYLSGNPPPLVQFPPPEAGDDYEPATGKAIMESTGKLIQIDVVDGGSGYSSKSPPTVTISPPERLGGEAAVATATVVSKGANAGSLASIQVQNTGSGYTLDDVIRVDVSPPELEGGTFPVVLPHLELFVSGITMTNSGSGYAVEKPLKIYVTSPKSGGDPIVIGQAFPRAEKSSYTAFRGEGDIIQGFEEAYESELNRDDIPRKRISGTASGGEDSLPKLPFWSGNSTSSKLLTLLPAGVGLEYDSKVKSYVLAVEPNFNNTKYPGWLQTSSSRPLNPEFGPRGRSPIERDKELGISTYLRFCASGAICASGVHLALVPLDVVKTKMQVEPNKYQSIGSSFGKIFKEEGPSTFFTGWQPTFAGNFLTGGVLYAMTELIRRYLTDVAGVDSTSLEVPIILAAAGSASFVGAFLSCPFEAVRIRSVAQPNFAPNSVGVLKRMLAEEGVGSLVNAIPVFLVKQVPYAMTKFTVFDISTERLYEAFPAANEDLKLSLLISLVGGILGGSAAAIISNPADCIISEMKKAKSDMGPNEAVSIMLERAGISSLFKGLPLRMVFYSLVASLQFVVYDSVRFALGIGPDDLKLYLDVLGSALQETGGPI